MSRGQRAGGYRTYWTAHRRLRLESARPLSDVDAQRLRPGTHEVEIVEIETGWNYAVLHFEGLARRSITKRLRAGTTALLGACMTLGIEAPRNGQFARLQSPFLGRRVRIVVENIGDVDLYVCADGTYLAQPPEGGVAEADTIEAMYQEVERLGLRVREPRVVEILRPSR